MSDIEPISQQENDLIRYQAAVSRSVAELDQYLARKNALYAAVAKSVAELDQFLAQEAIEESINVTEALDLSRQANEISKGNLVNWKREGF